MHNTYMNAIEVLLLTFKFYERVSEGPQYDVKTAQNWNKRTYTAKLLILDKNVYCNF